MKGSLLNGAFYLTPKLFYGYITHLPVFKDAFWLSLQKPYPERTAADIGCPVRRDCTYIVKLLKDV